MPTIEPTAIRLSTGAPGQGQRCGYCGTTLPVDAQGCPADTGWQLWAFSEQRTLMAFVRVLPK